MGITPSAIMCEGVVGSYVSAGFQIWCKKPLVLHRDLSNV